VERLQAQPSPGLLPIDRARLGVGRCNQSSPAWCREDAAATTPAEQLPGSLVARSGAIEQSNRDIDAEADKFRRMFSQQYRKIDHIDGRDERWEFNLEGDPSCATSIDACHEHL
jgi:hypothetical protein